MEKVSTTSQMLNAGVCFLWQEDLRELVGILEGASGNPIRIESAGYLFSSLDELFEKSGPRIRSLKLATARNGNGVRITLDVAKGESKFFVSSDTNFHGICAQLSKFLAERRGIAAYMFALRVPLIALFLTLSALAVAKLLVLPTWWMLSVGFMGAGVFWLFFTAVFFMWMDGGAVAIRNFSKTAHEFSNRERLIRYGEWFASAILGAVVAIAIQHVARGVGQ